MPGLAAGQVPVPHSAAGAFERRFQATLTADVFEFRFFTLLDVHADADHA